MSREIDGFVHQPAEWLRSSGPSSDVVISSRVRLARNVSGYSFEKMLDEKARKNLVSQIGTAFRKCRTLRRAFFIPMQDLDELDRVFLLERHLVSREHAEEDRVKAVGITPDEVVSLMVLEEDHLRLQTFQSGLNLQEAWKIADRIDSELEKSLSFAFSPSLGYLTACPTNVGSGLRASCMLHLPGLVLTKQIHKILQALGKLNIAVRGLYGEGTQAVGNLFQFSNQITLGQPEAEIMDNLKCVILQVIEHEQNARKFILARKKNRFEDQIWRAVGTLKTARIISSQEATGYLSLLQLGCHLGVVESGLTVQDLNRLFLLIQPAHLQKLAGVRVESAERDVKRAALLREHLKKVNV